MLDCGDINVNREQRAINIYKQNVSVTVQLSLTQTPTAITKKK